MKPFSILVLALVLPMPLLSQEKQPPSAAAKEEMKKLQGSWNIISGEMAGKKMTGKELGIDQMIFRGDKMAYSKEGKDVITFGFTLDPSKKPKEMEWIHLQIKDAPPLPAIYSLEGDELRICFPLLPKKGEKTKVTIQRPKDFETKDKPFGLFVAKREKNRGQEQPRGDLECSVSSRLFFFFSFWDKSDMSGVSRRIPK